MADSKPETVLLTPTPPAWVDYAVLHVDDLLIDHANCEKKAASTALSLLFAYADDRRLSTALSRLAREELRHFEAVQKMLEALGIAHRREAPGRYGTGLRAAVRTRDPGRKLDLLLVGALIEARSAERFKLLVPRLAEPLAEFYAGLERSEARHFELYLNLARAADASEGHNESAERLAVLAQREAELATTPDPIFRFHSGAPLHA